MAFNWVDDQPASGDRATPEGVALTDAAIDDFFNRVDVGMPVTIVGTDRDVLSVPLGRGATRLPAGP